MGAGRGPERDEGGGQGDSSQTKRGTRLRSFGSDGEDLGRWPGCGKRA